jgi:hypothetical protein
MMNSFRHLRNPWLQLHFLLLFVVYYAGSNFFAHTHTIDGQRVAHSHPFAGTSGHHHTTAEFSTLSLVSHFSATATVMVTAATSFRVVVSVLEIFKTTNQLGYYFKRSHFLRPPPSLQLAV